MPAGCAEQLVDFFSGLLIWLERHDYLSHPRLNEREPITAGRMASNTRVTIAKVSSIPRLIF